MFLNSSSAFRLKIHNLTSLVHWYTTFCIFTSLRRRPTLKPYPTFVKASKSSLTLNLHPFATTDNKHRPQKYKHNRKRFSRQTQPTIFLSFSKTLELRKETIFDIVMSVHPHHSYQDIFLFLMLPVSPLCAIHNR